MNSTTSTTNEVTFRTAQHLTSAEQHAREEDVLARVLASFDGCGDERLKTVMRSLVTHLHGFVREVRLTEEEWRAAIGFLAAAGHITDDRRQEFVLLSDVLGASMKTITINNEAYENATEATVLGPFFVEGAAHVELGGDIAFGVAGKPCWLEGTVTDTSGNPLPCARLEVWEADDEGLYDIQRDGEKLSARATCSPTKTALTASGPLHPHPTRFPAMVPLASCWKRPPAAPTALHTCTSWSPARASARLSPTSLSTASRCSTATRSSASAHRWSMTSLDRRRAPQRRMGATWRVAVGREHTLTSCSHLPRRRTEPTRITGAHQTS
jgi:hypothetical protein